MLINKLDLTFFSPHRKGVGFRGDYELGLEINPRVTFKGVWSAMQKGEDFYDIVGDEIDTVIRERIFAMMSEKFHIPYDDIYDLWISNYRKSKK